MATRHQAREATVGLLYAYDLGNEEIGKFADNILEEKKIRHKQKEFALSLFAGVLSHLPPIDEEIAKSLKKWEIDRLGAIEKAILRLGVYELLFTDTDRAVVINEAIEISKDLGSDQSAKFINGVLDAIKKAKGEQQRG